MKSGERREGELDQDRDGAGGARMRKGLFITFEGSEGVGKTTQMKRLAAKLRARGERVVLSREPGGTPLGEKIRHLLKHAECGWTMVPRTEVLLFAASRAQHVEELIRPNLGRGKVVMSDRYLDSTTVYQGVARAIGPTEVSAINRFAIDGLLPDLTVWIDLEPEIGFRRIQSRNSELPDRMEQEKMEFYRAVRKGYRELANSEPGRFLVVDGAQTPEEVEEAIWDGVKKHFD